MRFWQRFARCANYALIWINPIFLMFRAFISFPTAMMGEYPHHPPADRGAARFPVRADAA
jgi:uncharacterized membrane protein